MFYTLDAQGVAAKTFFQPRLSLINQEMVTIKTIMEMAFSEEGMTILGPGRDHLISDLGTGWAKMVKEDSASEVARERGKPSNAKIF